MILKPGKFLFFLLAIAALVYSCEHEPFPAPPGGMGNDTIKDPVDTTTKPIDTTQGPTVKPCDPDTVYFNRDILPILSSNCAYSGCHDAGTAKEGVVLNSYQNVIATADVRPGDLSGSDLYEVITETDPDKIMPRPPNKPLTQANIDLIAKWILQGAKNLTCDECDTANISFSQHIKPIFEKSCAVCHSGATPSGFLLLTNYGNITDAVINNTVISRINHQGSIAVMPPSGIKLDDCKLKQIEVWVKAGVPNN